MNPHAKMSDQDYSGEIFEFRPILPLFYDPKNYDPKYSHMCTYKKRLDETNSMVHEKINLKVNRVPKIGQNMAETTPIEHFPTN